MDLSGMGVSIRPCALRRCDAACPYGEMRSVAAYLVRYRQEEMIRLGCAKGEGKYKYAQRRECNSASPNLTDATKVITKVTKRREYHFPGKCPNKQLPDSVNLYSIQHGNLEGLIHSPEGTPNTPHWRIYTLT